MELTPDSLYIKYVRLKEEDETPQTFRTPFRRWPTSGGWNSAGP